jgi:hypothetical protein
MNECWLFNALDDIPGDKDSVYGAPQVYLELIHSSTLTPISAEPKCAIKMI